MTLRFVDTAHLIDLAGFKGLQHWPGKWKEPDGNAVSKLVCKCTVPTPLANEKSSHPPGGVGTKSAFEVNFTAMGGRGPNPRNIAPALLTNKYLYLKI